MSIGTIINLASLLLTAAGPLLSHWSGATDILTILASMIPGAAANVVNHQYHGGPKS